MFTLEQFIAYQFDRQLVSFLLSLLLRYDGPRTVWFRKMLTLALSALLKIFELILTKSFLI